MTEPKLTYDYQVGGSLDGNAPSYVTRQADRKFYQALKAGQFCYVLNSRQMGKSSLRVRTMQRLQAEGTVCIFIDLTGIGTQDITPEKWYAGIVQSLVSGCQLSSKIQWRTWWRERLDLLSPVQRLGLFIQEILLVEIQENIVIFVDEVDLVLSQKFTLDDFFGLIRHCYDQRETNINYQRLTFALLGVATPSDLIQDKTRTPFNIGQAIQLQGFQPDEIQPLIEGLQGRSEHPEIIMNDILNWTGGQPFLTQKLCQLVIRSNHLSLTRNGNNHARNQYENRLLEKRESEKEKNGISINYLDKQDDIQNIDTEKQNIKTQKKDNFNRTSYKQENITFVDQVVRFHILENWEIRDEPEHLRTIRDRIIRNDQRAVQLLGLYQKILQQGSIKADGSPEQMELRLSGLVVEKQGKLRVYNSIYGAVFDKKWVEKNLEKLRPYSQDLSTWIASEKRDTSCLLQGLKLQNALTWSLGKSLSDGDYQFLVASQELAKQQTQNRLEATEKASQLLASARSKAKQITLKQRIWQGWIPLTALAVTASIILLRLSGLLQGLEWSLLDQFFLVRPLEASEPLITIITIDETDIRNAGQWPIPDKIIAHAITQIKAQNPQAIGLDIYRDLPVEPGHTDLVKVFESSSNLFGVEKVLGNIAPPPVLSERGKVGFTDIVVDRDGKVRRALLSVMVSEKEVRHSLAVKLALHYLDAKEMNLEIVERKAEKVQQVRLGKAIFERFTGNEGGYVGADAGGYQILLNFRGNQENFSTFSLRELLNNQVPPDSFRDRLVIIGTIAQSINDFFYTPYNSRIFRSSKMMPGVVLHANVASQILNSALQGRSLIRVWPDHIEWLWISAIAVFGAGITWWWSSPTIITISLILATGGLLGGCYLAFLWGWWLPAVPSLLALLGSAVALSLVKNKQRDRLIFCRTLALLLEVQKDYPTSGHIAIEYLKQSETKENQRFISRRIDN